MIVGAGFAGLGMAVRLKRAGIEDFAVLERATEVGGTWRDNSYPGCQCDVPSNLYSFSFAPNPGWTRTYSRQPEIWDYLRDCAERFGLLPHLRLGCELLAAEWDEPAGLWRLETSAGRLAARALVVATGPLSEPAYPDLPGLDSFPGAVFHSAAWNHEHDLAGERVAVVGTGASAVQLIPAIQPQVSRLHVFQRTPAWVMPHRDRPVRARERRLYRRLPAAQRLVRTGVYWAREALVPFFLSRRWNRVAERAARRHLESQVRDPELRARLTPGYAVGCKRILVSNDFYPALQQPNVELVTEPIREVDGCALVTADGARREVDAIILATGFHVTDVKVAQRLRARGRTLAEAWRGSPQAYLGTTVAGFPNLFILLGPNTGLGHTSVVLMAEWQAGHVLDCLRALRRRRAASLEPRPEAQAAYNERLREAGRDTVWTTGGCRSWYLDEQGRNPTIWPGFTWQYRLRLLRFDPAAYRFNPPASERRAA